MPLLSGLPQLIAQCGLSNKHTGGNVDRMSTHSARNAICSLSLPFTLLELLYPSQPSFYLIDRISFQWLRYNSVVEYVLSMCKVLGSMYSIYG